MFVLFFSPPRERLVIFRAFDVTDENERQREDTCADGELDLHYGFQGGAGQLRQERQANFPGE